MGSLQLAFTIKKDAQGDTLITVVLELAFKNWGIWLLALITGTRFIWQKHLKEEMANSAALIKSLTIAEDTHV